MIRPAVIDIGREWVDIEVHAGEDEGEVGELCAGRSVRVRKVDILHTRNREC